MEKAQKALLGVIELDDDPEALCALSYLATRESNDANAKATALSYTTKAMSLGHDAADHAFKVGMGKHKSGEDPAEWALAKSFLDEVLKLLITAYLATNDSEHNQKAREASDRLVTMVPDDVEALSIKAEAYTRWKPEEQHLPSLQRWWLVVDNPWFADAFFRVGKRWQSLGQTEKALQSYRWAMNEAPFQARLGFAGASLWGHRLQEGG
eukprot:Skav200147  [mRNA]  locus=scaffold2013:296416:307280:- [translate_table: standard]